MKDSKGIAAMIVSKAVPKSDGPEEGSSEKEMLHCASAMMKAIHGSDASAFNDALKLWLAHADQDDDGGESKEY